MTVPTRSLGRNGPLVQAIGFGAMSFGGFYGQKDTDEEKFQVLDRAHEIGQRFWDTADAYGGSEDSIGEWFAKTGKRDDIFIATKFGLAGSPAGGMMVRNDPEYVREACERSLKRLGVETIDLYYMHRLDTTTPIEKAIEAMAQLKKEGKIRYLGLSECSASAIRRAHAVHPISAYQTEYSPFALDIESPEVDTLRTCRELGIAIVAYSPIGRGLLTGQIKNRDDIPEGDFRREAPRYSEENFPRILALVKEIESIAAAHKSSVAQICLAWLLAQGDDIIPIPGTRTVKYLEQNTEAANIQLTQKEVDDLRKYSEGSNIAGARYPDRFSMLAPRDSAPL